METTSLKGRLIETILNKTLLSKLFEDKIEVQSEIQKELDKYLNFTTTTTEVISNDNISKGVYSGQVSFINEFGKPSVVDFTVVPTGTIVNNGFN